MPEEREFQKLGALRNSDPFESSRWFYKEARIRAAGKLLFVLQESSRSCSKEAPISARESITSVREEVRIRAA